MRDLLPRKLPKTWGAMIDDLSKRLIFRTMETHHKNVISDSSGRARVGSVRFPGRAHLVEDGAMLALILDTPYHGVQVTTMSETTDHGCDWWGTMHQTPGDGHAVPS